MTAKALSILSSKPPWLFKIEPESLTCIFLFKRDSKRSPKKARVPTITAILANCQRNNEKSQFPTTRDITPHPINPEISPSSVFLGEI